MTQRPRILHVITGLSGGGAERSLYNLVTDPTFASFEIQVVCLTASGVYQERLRNQGIQVHALGIRMGPRGLRGVVRLMRIVRRFQPDVVQGWMYHGNLAAWVARALTAKRAVLVWNVRQSLDDVQAEKASTRFAIRANRWLSGSPGRIIYNSHVSRSHHEAFGLSAKHSVVIPNGFDTAQLAPSAETRARVRAELGVGEETILVGHFGRYHPMKGHALFISAAGEIAVQRDNVCFLMVGRGVEPDRAEIRDSMPSARRDRFVLLGEREDAGRVMQALDIFCLSSVRGEAFPNVLGEAMALAIPCVATDVGDCGRILGDAGRLVEAGNAQALSHALRELIELSPSERQQLGQRGRQIIEDCYQLASTVAEYRDLYRDLADTGGPE